MILLYYTPTYKTTYLIYAWEGSKCYIRFGPTSCIATKIPNNTWVLKSLSLPFNECNIWTTSA